MAMTNEAFEAMVKRLEPAARANPGLYRLRVASFAALGYLYLVATVVLLLAILGLGVIAVVKLQAAAIKFLIVYVPFLLLVLRAMWVELHPPTGIVITERTVPELFARIERLRKALGAPRFHRVVIDDHFNAAVVQVPLLGLFGWHRNYLVIGLPLMKALTPAQLDAVIAHELGHLAGGHARFSNWLYRLRLAWGQLLGELQRTRSRGAFLFRSFFDWYVPRFEAYSFPLARENEYAADAASARLASAPAAAQALTAVSVAGSYLAERYWPAILARASFEPQPSLAPFADLGPGLAVEIAGAPGQRWLADALARTTGFDNTHPCLADRLRALGEAPAIVPPAAGESADALLGEARESIIEGLDRRWQDQVIHDWRKRYDEAETARERLAFLTTAAGVRELDAGEAVERARLEYGVGGGAKTAIAQLREIVERHPDDAGAHYFFGAYLLGSGDAGGVAHLETAMRLEPGVTQICARTLRDYFASRGDAAEAAQWHARGLAAAEHDDAVRDERGTLRARDTLLPHGLGADAVATLRDALRSLGVRKAWLAQKKLALSAERPIYVLGYSILKRFQSYDAQRTRDVQRRILEDAALPGETFVFCVDGPNAPFGRRLAIADTTILPAA